MSITGKGSLSATRGEDLYAPSESGALAHAWSPGSLGVIQWAALWAGVLTHSMTCRTHSILVRLPYMNIVLPY